MAAVRYPVARNADEALSKPLGRAARESEARDLAGVAVEFVSEAAGSAYVDREAALDAFAGRVDDERPGRAPVAPEDRFCQLRETVERRRGRTPVRGQARPTFAEGRRWPPPAPPPPTAWRLSVSYWRVVDPGQRAGLAQARRARRSPQAGDLDRETVKALADQPLLPVRPQQPLDVGLFEVRPPEAPHILMPDE
ncbi:MAG: hypothetical protein IIZ63_13780 [Caulobacteraceae bacterium]|nr:hypothetical protein [Caulobacteraceae bacterium]